jgi:glycosyltransferase involved in cell wall biosynthesis
MTLSVIIPTYKRHEDLKRVISSAFEQNDPVYEVIVIIGPNDEESWKIASEWQINNSNLFLIQAQKPSVVHALNLGLSKAIGDILCLLDDDVWLPPDWSFKIKQAFEENKDLGVYGGRDHLKFNDPNHHLSNPSLSNIVGKFKWNGTVIGNHHCGSIKSPVCVDVLKGANLSFRRIAFNIMQIDSILEAQGAEPCWEIDICLATKKNGYKNIYDNNNYILHYVGKRLDFDQRNDYFSPVWSKRVFNEAFVTAKYRSAIQIIIYVLYSVVIGYRYYPGFVWSFLLLPKQGFKILSLPFKKIIFISKGMMAAFNK